MHVFIYYYMPFVLIFIIIVTIIVSMGPVGTCCSVFFLSSSMNCFSFLGCRACSVPVMPLTLMQCLQMTVTRSLFLPSAEVIL